MDSFKGLIDTHIKANKLGKEIKKIRGNIIKACKEKNSSDLYVLKVSYAGFAEQLNKETATFNTLLNNLDINEFDNENDKNCNIDEIIENSMDSDSSLNESQDQEVLNESYNNNTSVTNTITPNNCITELEEEKKDITEPQVSEKEEDKNIIHFAELYNDSVPMTDDLAIDNTQINVESPAIAPNEKVENTTNNSEEYPSLSERAIRPKAQNYNKRNNGAKVFKVKSGYKYGGKGFEAFTGFRNRCKPIYSSVMLSCKETCNENEEELRNYLVQNGKFKNEMIEQIMFKTRGYYETYALIKVRAPLKYIKTKINTLNKAKGKRFTTAKGQQVREQIVWIFRRSKSTSANELANANNVLYVNNFDILRKDTHKKFTKFFLKSGELVKDIKMGIDKTRDPYAIVHFRHVNDAIKCVKSELAFGGKVLSVRFSKF